MTTTTAPTTDRDRIRSFVVPTGVATVVVSSVWTVLGAHTWQEYTSMIALATIVAALVYGVVVPRALRRPAAPAAALTMSVVAALLTLPAFWTGLPLVLGAAGAIMGYAGRGSRTGAGASLAALVLGLLSVLGYLGIYVSELVTGVI